jgi:hypothetical protein
MPALLSISELHHALYHAPATWLSQTSALTPCCRLVDHAGCPAGTYFKYNADATQATCEICPFGSYCYNKMTFVTNNALNNLGATPCGDNLTTRTKRATSVWDCGEYPHQHGDHVHERCDRMHFASVVLSGPGVCCACAACPDPAAGCCHGQQAGCSRAQMQLGWILQTYNILNAAAAAAVAAFPLQ